MRVLIAYYSRTGVTRKTCSAVADVLRSLDDSIEVQVEEIEDRTDRSGARGYLAGGKDAMLRRPTEIGPVEAEVGSFDLVVIGTPVWAWTCAPAPRTFCEQFAQQIDRAAFVATMGGSGDRGAFKALAECCGVEPLATLTLLEKYVKSDDEENYRGRIEEFARELATKAGGQ